MSDSTAAYVQIIKRRFTVDTIVFGVSDRGEITQGYYNGIFARPGIAEYRYVIDTGEREVYFQVADNRVFKTRAEAEARANEIKLRYWGPCLSSDLL